MTSPSKYILISGQSAAGQLILACWREHNKKLDCDSVSGQIWMQFLSQLANPNFPKSQECSLSGDHTDQVPEVCDISDWRFMLVSQPLGGGVGWHVEEVNKHMKYKSPSSLTLGRSMKNLTAAPPPSHPCPRTWPSRTGICLTCPMQYPPYSLLDQPRPLVHVHTMLVGTTWRSLPTQTAASSQPSLALWLLTTLTSNM